MTDINANNIDIHETVEIGNNVRITCDTIKLGKFQYRSLQEIFN